MNGSIEKIKPSGHRTETVSLFYRGERAKSGGEGGPFPLPPNLFALYSHIVLLQGIRRQHRGDMSYKNGHGNYSS